MAEFRFRLAMLLRVRETARDERRASLAEIQREDDALAERIARLAAQRIRLQDECRTASEPGSLDVDRLAESHRFAAVLRLDEAETIRRRESLSAEIERRRHALLAADRDVRVLEKLQERQLARHRREECRLESKRLDEAALRVAVSG